MAEPVHRGAENPEFSAERALPEERIHLLEGRRSLLERKAAQAGSTLGRAVRNIQEKLIQGGEQGPSDKVRVMADRGRARAQELTEEAASRTQEFADYLRVRGVQLQKRAQERWSYLRQERPIHVAIGAGAVGFLIGVGLRLRRAHNAE